MSVIRRMRTKDAVYWPPTTPDEHGRMQYGNPVPVRCRWDDVNELFINREGVQEVSKSKVYTDIDVLPQGVLWKGHIDTLLHPRNPWDNKNAWEIKQVSRIDNFRGTETLTTAFL